MTITAWFLLIFFGIFSVRTLWQFISGKTIGWLHALLWFFAMIITAISAGIIWGDLFSNLK